MLLRSLRRPLARGNPNRRCTTSAAAHQMLRGWLWVLIFSHAFLLMNLFFTLKFQLLWLLRFRGVTSFWRLTIIMTLMMLLLLIRVIFSTIGWRVFALQIIVDQLVTFIGIKFLSYAFVITKLFKCTILCLLLLLCNDGELLCNGYTLRSTLLFKINGFILGNWFRIVLFIILILLLIVLGALRDYRFQEGWVRNVSLLDLDVKELTINMVSEVGKTRLVRCFTRLLVKPVWISLIFERVLFSYTACSTNCFQVLFV